MMMTPCKSKYQEVAKENEDDLEMQQEAVSNRGWDKVTARPRLLMLLLIPALLVGVWLLARFMIQSPRSKLIPPNVKNAIKGEFFPVVELKKKEMGYIDRIKSGHCGGYDRHVEAMLSGKEDNESNWVRLDTLPGLSFEQDSKKGSFCGGGCPSIDKESFAYFCSSGAAMNGLFNHEGAILNTGAAHEHSSQGCKPFRPFRSVCHAMHPVHPDVTVSIERIGPFQTFGGYDWNLVAVRDVAGLSKVLEQRGPDDEVHIVGGMATPVNRHGRIYEYGGVGVNATSPVHLHHAHIYPNYSGFDHHHVMIQAHGDSACQAEQGGTACLLHVLDVQGGQGHRLSDDHSGLVADFELNDARILPQHEELLKHWEGSDSESIERLREIKGLPSLDLFMDLVIMHRHVDIKRTKTQPVTYLSMGNPCVGSGPGTYALPMDPHSSVMWFSYKHENLLPGTLKNFIIHTHQHFFDSLHVFKGNGVFEAVDEFRKDKGGLLPLILDCNGHDIKSATEDIMGRIKRMAPDALHVCSVYGPNLIAGQEGHTYDRQVDKHCLESVHVDVNEMFTIVAFNRILPDSPYRRDSLLFNYTNASIRKFAALQHTIIRGDFIADYPDAYAPPSFYNYAEIDDDFGSHDDDLEQITRMCRRKQKKISYEYHLPE